MKNVSIESAKVHIELDFTLKGSVAEGTVESNVSEVRSSFFVTSGDPDDKVKEVVRLAKQGCFAEKMLQAAVPLTSTIELNGENFSI